ncbi:MAG: lamin tail domain-containing protein [Candidatus Thorarchaeota archaeon]
MSGKTNSGLCAGGMSGSKVGMTNGMGKSFGLTNGNSLVNGNGMGKSFGLTNGNGLVNGNGLTNGNGMINGNSFDAPSPIAVPRKKFLDSFGIVAMFVLALLIVSTVFVGIIYEIPSDEEGILVSSFEFSESWGCEGVVNVYENTISFEFEKGILSDSEYANSLYLWLFLENTTGASVPSLWGSSDILVTCILHEDSQKAMAYTSGLDLTGGVGGGVQVDDKVIVSFSRFQLGLREDLVISEVRVALENMGGLLVDSVALFDSISPVGDTVSFSDDGLDSMDDVVSVSITMSNDVSFVSIEIDDALLFVPHKLYRVVTEKEDSKPQPPMSIVRPEDKPVFIPSLVKEPYYGVSIRSNNVERVGLLFNHEGFEGDINSLSVDGSVVVFSVDSFRLWGCDEVVFSSSWGVCDIITIHVDSGVPTKALGDHYDDSTSRVLILQPDAGSSNATIETVLTKYNYDWTTQQSVPTLAEMLDYEFVIVSWGDKNGGLSASLKTVIWDYVNESGHLWIEGGEIGYVHRNDGDFLNEVFLCTGWNSDDPDPAPAGGNYMVRETRDMSCAYYMNDTITINYVSTLDNDVMVWDTNNITPAYYWYEINTPSWGQSESNPSHIYTPFEIDVIHDDDREKIVANILECLTPTFPKVSQHPTITVDGSKSDWLGTASTTDDTSVSSKQEFIWTDKENDDNGDGAYTYPSPSSRWGADTLDIVEFRCASNDGKIYLMWEFKNLTNNESYSNGFSEVALGFYFGSGGIFQGFNNSNVSFLHHPASYCFLSGENVSIFKGGVWNYSVSYELSANTSNSVIEFSFTFSDVCTVGVGDTIEFYGFVGAYDDNDGMLDALGKGVSTYPNWYDSMFTADLSLLFNSPTNGVIVSNIEDGLGGLYVDTTIKRAQSFFVGQTIEVGAVRLKGNDVGLDSKLANLLDISIQSDGGNFPSGTDLTSVDTADFSDSIYEWVKTDFTSPATLQPNTRYWIVLECAHSSNNGYLLYTGSDQYSEGNVAYDSGSGWTNQTQYDFFFEVIPENETFVQTSHTEFVFGSPVYINEVSSYGSGDEWIELYNGGSSSVNISGWTIQNKTFGSYTFINTTISAGGYLVFHIVASDNSSTNSSTDVYWKFNTSFLNDTSDEVILNNTLWYHHSQDYMAYGSTPSSLPRDVSFYGSTIPSAPSSGGSLSRYPNGQDYDKYDDWDREHPSGWMSVTEGGENQVIPFLSNLLVLLVVVVVFFIGKKKKEVE